MTTTSQQIPTPQFRELRFKSNGEFNTWLRENTHITIDFEDTGADLIRTHVHSTGEILNSNAHQKIYIGAFVLMDKVEVGKPVWIIIPHMHDTKYREMKSLVVEDIKFKKQSKNVNNENYCKNTVGVVGGL